LSILSVSQKFLGCLGLISRGLLKLSILEEIFQEILILRLTIPSEGTQVGKFSWKIGDSRGEKLCWKVVAFSEQEPSGANREFPDGELDNPRFASHNFPRMGTIESMRQETKHLRGSFPRHSHGAVIRHKA
jgi:hypothetical protein